ncbi:hypothetical protein OH77DRAFT_1521881 [Trametes cingulata]|nr:hypothetical protein OH77DRAFT_1521881 [Trametes cingulata]
MLSYRSTSGFPALAPGAAGSGLTSVFWSRLERYLVYPGGASFSDNTSPVPIPSRPPAMEIHFQVTMFCLRRSQNAIRCVDPAGNAPPVPCQPSVTLGLRLPTGKWQKSPDDVLTCLPPSPPPIIQCAWELEVCWHHHDAHRKLDVHL